MTFRARLLYPAFSYVRISYGISRFYRGLLASSENREIHVYDIPHNTEKAG